MRVISIAVFILVAVCGTQAQLGTTLPKSVDAASKQVSSFDPSSVTKAAKSLDGNIDQFSSALKGAGIDPAKAKSITSAVSALDGDTDQMLKQIKGASDLMSLKDEATKILADVRKVDGLMSGVQVASNVTSKWGSVKSSANALGSIFGLKL
ncbi:MAG: hypothetical protein NTX15_05020 [Candidatus Kapabacteria bacterium]|nr:hypothetical protein [Candidatus Kapabacteria bacterium]